MNSCFWVAETTHFVKHLDQLEKKIRLFKPAHKSALTMRHSHYSPGLATSKVYILANLMKCLAKEGFGSNIRSG